MAESFPTKEQMEALQKMSQQNLYAVGTMVSVTVFPDGGLGVAVDGYHVFNAKGTYQVEVKTYVRPPPASVNGEGEKQ